ncbi:MAG TPA: Fur family transcriptional regulator [Mycobacteriales bacterium]|nr:Fur family transcriptional regulator [Mycobacteriales bacterium]
MSEIAARRRSTRQGVAVDEVLAGADGFLTAQALYDVLRARGDSVGLTTVYRHLRRLAEDGAVDVVARPDGELAYRRCGPAASGEPEQHHHHLVCRTCGYSVEIEGPEVESWAQQVAADAGFTDVSHTLEIFGECDRHAGG